MGRVFAGGRLKKIRVTGGPAATLADVPNARSGAWGDDGTIVFFAGRRARPRLGGLLNYYERAARSSFRLTSGTLRGHHKGSEASDSYRPANL